MPGNASIFLQKLSPALWQSGEILILSRFITRFPDLNHRARRHSKSMRNLTQAPALLASLCAPLRASTPFSETDFPGNYSGHLIRTPYNPKIRLPILLLLVLLGCQSEKDKSFVQVGDVESMVQVTLKDSLVTRDVYFNKAYNEIARMLEGKLPLDFKRAVFLTEWSYLEGNLDYDKYCRDIAATAQTLKAFIRERGIGQYKTAGNFALYEFFTRPNKLNGNQPYTYDFNDFTGKEDWRQTFVTKLIETHMGNCRSLPYYYKILAEELQTEAFLAIAPNHIYIKHLDEQGKWVNVELTNGHFSSDAWMISSTGMSAEAIQNGIYMEALDLEKSVAYCLTELAIGYQRKYGDDEFGLLCCNKTLAYFPRSIHTLMQKHTLMRSVGMKRMEKFKGQKPTPEMIAWHEEFKQTEALIERLGYREMPPDKYEQWLKSMEREKSQQLSHNSLTSAK